MRTTFHSPSPLMMMVVVTSLDIIVIINYHQVNKMLKEWCPEVRQTRQQLLPLEVATMCHELRGDTYVVSIYSTVPVCFDKTSR